MIHSQITVLAEHVCFKPANDTVLGRWGPNPSRFTPLIEVTWRDTKWPQEGAATLQDSNLNFSLLCVFSLEHCWPTHINHLYTLYEAVIMVYHTLQMHYSSPILTRLTYIITCGRMHYICMCMYIMAYMCIYTDIHVTDLFMYFAYIHVLIYPYICCIFFCVCVWAGLSVRTKVWGMR